MGKIEEMKNGTTAFDSSDGDHVFFNNIEEMEKFSDELNAALIERDTYVESDDGWIENTGLKPNHEGMIDVKFRCGDLEQKTNNRWDWSLEEREYLITHWRPVR